jgi:hypothetical protein
MTTQTIDFSSIDKVVFGSTEIKEFIHNDTSIWTYTYAESALTTKNVPVLQESSTVNSYAVTYSAADFPIGTYEVLLLTQEFAGQYGYVQDILQKIMVYDLDMNYITGGTFGEGSTFESDPDGDDYNVISSYGNGSIPATSTVLEFTTASAGFQVIAQHTNQHPGCDANSSISFQFREKEI